MLDQKNIEVQDESVKRWMARQMGDKLSQIGTMTSIWASHAGRSQPGYFDVERTFKSMNITAGDLAAEVKANEGKPMPKIDFPVPETRVHHTPAKPLLGATSAKEMVKHPNVPSFLPPFPGPHTYKSTPMVPNNKIDYVESREKMALKRRQEKDNLNHLYKRMKQTVSLFSEPTGRFDLLDLEPPKRPAYMDALMPRDQTYEIDIYGDNDPIPEQAPKNPFLMPPKPPGTPKTPFPIDLGLIYNEYKGPLTTGMMIESTDSPKTSESAEALTDLSKAEEIVVQINEHTNIKEQKPEAEFEQASTSGSEEKVLKISKKNKKQKKAKESKADLLWSATSEGLAIVDLNNIEPVPVLKVEETQEKENIGEQQLEAEFEQASTCGSEEKVLKRSKKNKKQKKAKESKADLLWSATSEDLNNIEPEHVLKVEETQEKEIIAEQQLEAEFEQASTSGSEEKVLKISKKNKKQKKAKESKADLLWSATSEDLNNVEPEHVLKVEETQEKEIIAEQQLEAEFEHASTCGSEEKVLKRSKKNKKQKKAKESKADLLWSATSEDLNNLEPEPEPVEVEETQEKENIAEQQLEAEFEQASTCGSKEKVLKRSKKNKKQKKAKESKADLLWSATYEDLNNLEPEPMDVEETQEKEIIAEQQLEAEFEQASTCGSEEKVLKISKKNKKQKKAKESKADLLWSATSEDLNNIEPVPVLKVEETQERENIAEQQKKNKKQKKAKESKADLLWSATSEDLNNLEPEHVLKVEETQEKEIIAEQQLEAEFEQASTSGFGENLPQSSHSKKRRFMEDKKRDKREKKSRAEMFARLANEVSKDVENKENVPISVNKPLREGKKSKRNA
ncbi:blast:Transcription initiation factor TFIID subunit 8 [Drosophila guanche]|nr:blast:Transcription initiation factor TFIID subunit 8 [Drosophila guanche]